MSRRVYRVVQGEEPSAPMGRVHLRCGSLRGAKKAARELEQRLPYKDVVSVYRESGPGSFDLVYDLNSNLMTYHYPSHHLANLARERWLDQVFAQPLPLRVAFSDNSEAQHTADVVAVITRRDDGAYSLTIKPTEQLGTSQPMQVRLARFARLARLG